MGRCYWTACLSPPASPRESSIWSGIKPAPTLILPIAEITSYLTSILSLTDTHRNHLQGRHPGLGISGHRTHQRVKIGCVEVVWCKQIAGEDALADLRFRVHAAVGTGHTHRIPVGKTASIGIILTHFDKRLRRAFYQLLRSP